MIDPRRSSTLELLRASRDDEAVLPLPLPDRIFGFHAQQAIEKLLKALIAAHNVLYLFTHNLNTLLSQLSSLDESIPLDAESVTLLNEFAVDWRYDEPSEIDLEQRTSYREMVAVTRTLVFARLADLRPGTDWVAAVAA